LGTIASVFYFSNFLLFWGGGTGVWTQGSHLQTRHSTAWATSPAHLAPVILEMGVFRTICSGWLEPRSSWSLPPEQLGIQAWATNAHSSIFLFTVLQYSIL
jgi:hypothetical protein